MPRELPVGDRPDAHRLRKHALHPRRQPDERRDRGVRASIAEERALEVAERPVEAIVVPVEAAARLGDADQEVEQDRAKERVVGGGIASGVGAGVDRSRRLAAELLQRDERVLTATKAIGALLDERPDQRPILVERRAVAAIVLLEGEREALPRIVELAQEVGERAEREGAQRMVELGRPRRHGNRYRLGGRSLHPVRALSLVRASQRDLSNRRARAPRRLAARLVTRHRSRGRHLAVVTRRAGSPRTSTRCGSVTEATRANDPAAARARALRAAVDGALGPSSRHRGPHAVAAPLQRLGELVVGRLAHREPGREARVPEQLREPHVPDPGHHPLVDEDVAEQPRWIRRAESRDEIRDTRGVGEQIGAESTRHARIELEHRPVPLGRLPARRAQDEPRATSPGPLADRSDTPAPVHPEMTAKDDIALEAEQQVLAHRVDRLEHAAVDRLGDVRHEPARVGRRRPDPLADEWAEPRGGSME